MRILILEDNKWRIAWFEKTFANHELYITKNIIEAYAEVSKKEYDILFLDHDLEIENLKAVREERTGYDFVKKLVDNKLQQHAGFYIHSCNPAGGNAMFNLLKENKYQAEWIPFYLLIQSGRK